MNIKGLLKKENIYISVSIVDDKRMRELNSNYLSRDYPTDVLSFEIGEKQVDGTYYLGDVIVNKEQAERQSKEYGNSFEKEISELVEHGVLHLLGVHHKEEK
ncbi:MAG: rRNA maturation RNase YbeY [Patescibacteria group bacterium]